MTEDRDFRHWMFAVPPGARSAWDVVLWWERRRIPYNVILGVVGVCSLLLFHVFIEAAHGVPPGEDAVEPIMLFIAPVVANLCYTAGWLVEVPARWIAPRAAERLGPGLLKLGLGFSLLVALLPTVVWAVIALVRLLS